MYLFLKKVWKQISRPASP